MDIHNFSVFLRIILRLIKNIKSVVLSQHSLLFYVFTLIIGMVIGTYGVLSYQSILAEKIVQNWIDQYTALDINLNDDPGCDS